MPKYLAKGKTRKKSKSQQKWSIPNFKREVLLKKIDLLYVCIFKASITNL